MKIGVSMLSRWPALLGEDEKGRMICHRERLREHLRGLPARGAHHFEFTWDPPDAMEELFDAEWNAFLGECQAERGMSFSVHLPQFGLDMADPSLVVAEHSLREMLCALRCTRAGGMGDYVLHLGITVGRLWGQLSFSSPALRDHLWEEARSVAQYTLRRLLQEVPPRRIAVENIPYAPFSILEPLLEEFDLSVCLDVGHADRWGQDPMAFFERYRDRISVIHFHDVKRPGEPGIVGGAPDHQALGTGHLDYLGLLRTFRERGFDGTLVIEVQTPEDEEASLKRCREALA
jgi:sugar phosphate isomerase/epimerase